MKFALNRCYNTIECMSWCDTGLANIFKFAQHLHLFLHFFCECSPSRYNQQQAWNHQVCLSIHSFIHSFMFWTTYPVYRVTAYPKTFRARDGVHPGRTPPSIGWKCKLYTHRPEVEIEPSTLQGSNYSANHYAPKLPALFISYTFFFQFLLQLVNNS